MGGLDCIQAADGDDVTEDEAKEKWCPFTRYIGTVDGSPKAISGDVTCCIASDCMAWRWGHKDTMPAADGLHGYCGLSGKP